jgi:hypothetical protein
LTSRLLSGIDLRLIGESMNIHTSNVKMMTLQHRAAIGCAGWLRDVVIPRTVGGGNRIK